MDKFSQYLAFVRTVEKNSITDAADSLGWNKSLVSRRISSLENHLGVKLINRTTRTLSVTDSGRSLYQHFSRILQDIEEAEEAISDAQQALRGNIRITAPMSFGTQTLAPLIARFISANPEVFIDLDLSDRKVNIVDEAFDLAVRTGRLADSTLIARKIADIPRYLVASPAYVGEHGHPVSPDEIAEHRVLRYTHVPNSVQWLFTDDEGKAYSPQLNVAFQANNGEMLAHAAISGLGLLVAPAFIVEDALKSGKLLKLMDSYSLSSEGLYLVFPPGRLQSRRVRVLSQFLQNALAA